MAMGVGPIPGHDADLREQLMKQLPGENWELREVPQDPVDNKE